MVSDPRRHEPFTVRKRVSLPPYGFDADTECCNLLAHLTDHDINDFDLWWVSRSIAVKRKHERFFRCDIARCQMDEQPGLRRCETELRRNANAVRHKHFLQLLDAFTQDRDFVLKMLNDLIHCAPSCGG